MTTSTASDNTNDTNVPVEKKPAELVRQIGLITAIACGVGSVIGSGIFKKPGVMAAQLGSPELLILVWIVTGLMTLFGTLSIAECSGMFPESGGQYIYFNKSYNRFIGYIYGWGIFIVIQTGSIASIAYVFSDSLGYFFQYFRMNQAWETFHVHIPYIGDITPFKYMGLKLTTIGLILLLTIVNYLGVRMGGIVQVIFTALKIFAIGAIIVFAFVSGHGNISNFTVTTPDYHQMGGISIFLAFIVAMSGAFWAYDGWITITYIGSEIKNVKKNLPKAMIYSTLIFIALYILINLAYFYIIPASEMAQKYRLAEAAGQSYLVATDVASKFWGSHGGSIIAIAIIISTFGAVNGMIMMSARVYYAMSKEKMFFKRLQDIHPRYKTPGPSLIVQGIWASLLVLSGTFDQLTDMLIFVSWIFYGLAAYGVILLRKKMPDAVRPYKTWGYPYVPYIFVFFSIIFVVFTMVSDIMSYTKGQSPLINSVMGLILIAIGIPGYIYWTYISKNSKPEPH